MAEIFLSYANEDREEARKLAGLLETAGWTVWWDRRVPAGQTWRSVIENALREMRCMVVLWSKNSVESHWVKEEAEEARALDKLVPVFIESVKPPVGFRAIQAADLVGWDGSTDAPGALQLIADLEARLGKPTQRAPSEPAMKARQDDPVAVIRADHERIDDDAATATPSQRWEIGSEQTRPGAQTTSRLVASLWKLAAVGGLVIAVALTFWLRPDPEQTPGDRPSISKPTAPEPPQAPRLVSLGVSGERQEIKSEETLSLSLRGHYADGTQNEITERVEWVSSNPRVATVDNQGLVRAHQPGVSQITAQYADLSSSPWTLKVQIASPVAKPDSPVNLVGLVVGADKQEIRVREKTVLRVTASYSDGSRKALSKGVVWQTSDPRIASVNSRGELEALRPGKVEVTVRSGGLASRPWAMMIEEAPKRAPVELPAPVPAEATKVSSPKAPVDRASIASHMNRAKDYRMQGNYAAALAELEKARSMDPAGQDIGKEIEATKRACNAEKKLGRAGLEC
jgi:hypothetical protein